MRRLRVSPRMLVAVLVLAVIAGTLLQLKRVHDQGWEWRLLPSAAPPKIEYSGRYYQRSTPTLQRLPSGQEPRGRTPGGGVIYAKPVDGGFTPVLIYVRGGRQVFAYGLMGGP